MAHGILRGVKSPGPVHGVKHGTLLFSGSNPMAGVTRDGSLIYTPSTNGEWTTTMSAAGLATGNPTSLWLTQEASGNLADTLAAGNTLTVAGASWLYQQAISGWTRKGLTVPDASANHNAQNTTTVPDILTTSVMLLAYVFMPAAAPAATRRIMRLDSTTGAVVVLNTTGTVGCLTQGTGGTTVNGTSNACTGVVRPIVLRIDKTNNRVNVYTDQDKIVGTQGTYAGLVTGFGSQSSNTPAIGLLYEVMFSGSAAELTDAQVKSLLQTLGWTIPWS